MGVYIKNRSLADWKELLKWAKIGANNAMIGEFTEVEELPPHGDLIDRDALAERLGITDMDCFKCAWGNHGFCGRGGDFNDACEAIEDAPTIIPASEEGET